jgi:transporter family-2 protein
MNTQAFNYVIALVSGMLLALMIACNSQLASYSSPTSASWVAHGIGVVVAFLLLSVTTKLVSNGKSCAAASAKTPLWAYLGGVPGALTVVLAAITVNSQLGLSSSLALMLVGKVVFGLVCDMFGFFGVRKKRLSLHDVTVVMLIMLGSAMIIYFRAV